MSAPQATAFNMHTDMVIGSDDHGYWLTGTNGAGTTLSVRITNTMAAQLSTVAGGSGTLTADAHAQVPVNPDNMHTDNQTGIHINQAGTKITIVGPASTPTGDTTLTLTITGPALTYTQNAA